MPELIHFCGDCNQCSSHKPQPLNWGHECWAYTEDGRRIDACESHTELKQVKADSAMHTEAANALFCVIAEISLTVGIPDSAPNICQETVKAVKQLADERDALRSALRFIANHEAEPGSTLETVTKFARLTLGEDAT